MEHEVGWMKSVSGFNPKTQHYSNVVNILKHSPPISKFTSTQTDFQLACADEQVENFEK